MQAIRGLYCKPLVSFMQASRGFSCKLFTDFMQAINDLRQATKGH